MANQATSDNTKSSVQSNNSLLWADQFTKRIDERKEELYKLKLSSEKDLSDYVYNELIKKEPDKTLSEDRVLKDENNPLTEGQLGYADLWLPNAVTQNKEQDQIDKTRYVKEVKSYVNINSLLRYKYKTEGEYPSPSRYVIPLSSSLTNVKSARIIQSEIPKTQSIIRSLNNLIIFEVKYNGVLIPTTEGGSDYDFNYYVPVGDYTASEFATQVQTDMNNLVSTASGGAYTDVFTISIDQVKNISSFSVASGFEFTINFVDYTEKYYNLFNLKQDDNLYQILGFEKSDYFPDFYTTLTNQVESTNGSQLVPYAALQFRLQRYVMLSIRELNTAFDEYTSQNYFCTFTFNDTDFGQMAINTFSRTTSVFDPPLRNLFQLTIIFLTEFGQVANFNNIDNAFTIEFVTLSDQLMGNNLDTGRGVSDRSSYI